MQPGIAPPTRSAGRHRRRLHRAGAALGALAAAVAGTFVAHDASAAGTGVTCGMQVTADVTLDRDLTCSGTVFTIVANHVKIDLNHHRLTGSDAGGVVIVAMEKTGITLENGTIERLGGMHLRDVSDVLISHVDFIEGGIIGGEDIGQVTIQSCHVLRGGGLDLLLGFEIAMEDVSFVDGVAAVVGSQTGGISCDRCLIAGNQEGFDLWQGGYDHITNSVIEDQAGAGILVDDESLGDEIFSNDLFLRNGVGLQLGTLPHDQIDAPGSQVIHDLFIDNGSAGLLVFDGKERLRDTVIAHNAFIHNGFHPGAVVDASGGPVQDGAAIFLSPTVGPVTVSDNEADGNAGYGIDATGVVDGGGNRASGNGVAAQCAGVQCD